ncbi:hypothetical protein SDC9_200585 [bioreactor metagenome]|uniref:SigmaK-factor processing regulatory protein BofA n=1 Tax=bioreactor metagenome TaxID=1076179 RepID=A0A645IPX3_9ZZZZ|nr:pro-sigmaK processing inhibitor BofA family protein [Lachnospiraceae bacterium]
MGANAIIYIMLGICGFLILAFILAKPIKFLIGLLINAISGLILIIAANFVLAASGAAVGINALTVFIVTVLGLPGAAALIVIRGIF